ncbi:MAG: MmcQ/YjbR family DNA-binding protein [Aureispira sp.]
MNIELLREYCLSKVGTTEAMPFGPEVLVFKVANKVFALTNIEAEDFTVNLKCAPDYAVELRELHPEVRPGWHMNKKHWNTVDFEGSLKRSFLLELVDHSYDMVVKGLTKKAKAALEAGEEMD